MGLGVGELHETGVVGHSDSPRWWRRGRGLRETGVVGHGDGTRWGRGYMRLVLWDIMVAIQDGGGEAGAT